MDSSLLYNMGKISSTNMGKMKRKQVYGENYDEFFVPKIIFGEKLFSFNISRKKDDVTREM